MMKKNLALSGDAFKIMTKVYRLSCIHRHICLSVQDIILVCVCGSLHLTCQSSAMFIFNIGCDICHHTCCSYAQVLILADVLSFITILLFICTDINHGCQIWPF